MNILGIVAYVSAIAMSGLAVVSITQRHSARRWLPFTDSRAVLFAALCMAGAVPVFLFDGALLFGIAPSAATITALGIINPLALIGSFAICAWIEFTHRRAVRRRVSAAHRAKSGPRQVLFAQQRPSQRTIRLGADGEIEDSVLPPRTADHNHK
jgi:hypothetical protein